MKVSSLPKNIFKMHKQVTHPHQVFFDLNTHIKKKDLDELLAYLECGSQSAGGRIKTFQLVQSKYQSSLIVIYETLDDAERILARKFLRFKFYFIRASETGYKNDSYELNRDCLIVQCLDKVKL